MTSISTSIDVTDPVDSGNLEIMDFLFENKEKISSYIYKELAELIAANESRLKSVRFFKLKYVLTETISIAEHLYCGSCEDPKQNMNTMFDTETSEKIICGTRKSTGRKSFDDILKGQIQLHANGEPFVRKGATFVKTVHFTGGDCCDWEETTSGQKNSIMHILSIEELNYEVISEITD